MVNTMMVFSVKVKHLKKDNKYHVWLGDTRGRPSAICDNIEQVKTITSGFFELMPRFIEILEEAALKEKECI
jgi:uncharacterized membrane protein YecN with MAPEG domain